MRPVIMTLLASVDAGLIFCILLIENDDARLLLGGLLALANILIIRALAYAIAHRTRRQTLRAIVRAEPTLDIIEREIIAQSVARRDTR